jgi:hypothetical protein
MKDDNPYPGLLVKDEENPEFYNCPKCGYASGNDWSQCQKDCPVPISPVYSEATEEKYRKLT